MKLTLKGFQSHDETVLDLSGRLVCVTGPNNVGKSAVVRAARWAFYDALRGSKFVKNGSAEARVEVEIDGRVLARVKSRKSGGRNAYEVDGKALESIGTGAPPEVTALLGTPRVRIDKDLELELNVVPQKEHPFLMDAVGTAKAKILNALTGLHVLDIAIRETASRLRSHRASEKALAERRDGISKELESFADLPGKEEAVCLARSLGESILAKAEWAKQVRTAISDLAAARSQVQALRSKPIPDMSALEAVWARMEAQILYVGGMRTALRQVADARAARASLAVAGVPDIPAAQGLIDFMEARQQFKDSAVLAVAARREAESRRSEIAKLDADLRRYSDEMAKFVGTECGECGRALTADCLAEAAC